MRTPRLSVVVANASGDRAVVAPALSSYARELGDNGVQLVWVDRAALPVSPPMRRFESVQASPDASRGDLYGLGLSRADGDVVAFTDSTTELLEGWYAAVVDAFASGARLTGGPVYPATPRTFRSWAGFLMEYAPHAVPPYVNSGGDVSGNNVAYVASVLEEFRGGPIWKSAVNHRLATQRIRPAIVEGMRVRVRKTYDWPSLLRDRISHGRQFALQRSSGWRTGRRMARAVVAPALPAVLFGRLAAASWGDRDLRRHFTAAAPAILAASLCWSMGELAGYIARGEPRKGLL